MTRNQPSQVRSRKRVEQILLAAQSLILESEDLDLLTTSAIAEHSGMSLATIYRYFEDRFEIILALIEREIETLDDLTIDAVASPKTVTVESLTKATLMARFHYFDGHPLATILWFGARESEAVHERIERHYSETIGWLTRGCVGSGMVEQTLPDWAGEAASWLADQIFETMFTKVRPREERLSIMSGFLDLLGDQLAKFTTDAGRLGVASSVFIDFAGDLSQIDSEAGVR